MDIQKLLITPALRGASDVIKANTVFSEVSGGLVTCSVHEGLPVGVAEVDPVSYMWLVAAVSRICAAHTASLHVVVLEFKPSALVDMSGCQGVYAVWSNSVKEIMFMIARGRLYEVTGDNTVLPVTTLEIPSLPIIPSNT